MGTSFWFAVVVVAVLTLVALAVLIWVAGIKDRTVSRVPAHERHGGSNERPPADLVRQMLDVLPVLHVSGEANPAVLDHASLQTTTRPQGVPTENRPAVKGLPVSQAGVSDWFCLECYDRQADDLTSNSACPPAVREGVADGTVPRDTSIGGTLAEVRYPYTYARAAEHETPTLLSTVSASHGMLFQAYRLAESADAQILGAGWRWRDANPWALLQPDVDRVWADTDSTFMWSAPEGDLNVFEAGVWQATHGYQIFVTPDALAMHTVAAGRRDILVVSRTTRRFLYRGGQAADGRRVVAAGVACGLDGSSWHTGGHWMARVSFQDRPDDDVWEGWVDAASGVAVDEPVNSPVRAWLDEGPAGGGAAVWLGLYPTRRHRLRGWLPLLNTALWGTELVPSAASSWAWQIMPA